MKKGTLKVCSIGNLKDYSSPVNFMIVRKLLSPVNNTIHLPELSPSETLLNTALEAKRNNNIEQLNKALDRFEQRLNEPNYLAVIKMIKHEFLDKGIDVTLVCYCPKLEHCHRQRVANKFKSLDCNVVMV